MEVEKASEKTPIKEKEEEKTQGKDSAINGSILSEELGASDSASQFSYNKKRKNPRESKVWNYFSSEKGKFKCNSCDKEFSSNSSTSTLKNHYEKFHASKSDIPNNDEKKIYGYFPPIAQKTYIDAFINFLILSRQPFSLVEEHAFQNFCRILNPNFKLPCRKTLTSLINNAYMDKKIKIQSYLQNLSSKLSLTFDGWTSPNNEPILGISGTNLNRFYLFSNIINNFIFSKRIL